MNLPGFVNIVSLCRDKPIDDTTRLNQLSFVWGDDAKIFPQGGDKPIYFSGSSASRQFRQNHGTAANNECKIQNLLFKITLVQIKV